MKIYKLNAKNMKRLVNLFAVVLIAVLSLGFVSCSSDNEESTPTLKGSTFVAYAYRGGGFLGENDYYDVYWVIKFVSDTEYEKTSRQATPTGRIIAIETGTYVFNYPKVTLTSKTGLIPDNVVTYNFVDSNTFRFDDVEYNRQ